jgi:hypothetical protein
MLHKFIELFWESESQKSPEAEKELVKVCTVN